MVQQRKTPTGHNIGHGANPYTNPKEQPRVSKLAAVHIVSKKETPAVGTDCVAQQLTSIALLIFGLYSTTNRIRHTSGILASQVPDMLAQYIREGAKHHPNASAVLDNRWNRDRQTQPLPHIPYTI